VKKILRRRIWRFSDDAEFGLEETCGGDETVSRQKRNDICLVRSRSHVTGVALEWHQLRCLEAGRLMRGSAFLSPMRPDVPLSMDSPVVSARRSCPRSRNRVQDCVWSKFLTHQDYPCVVESHHSVRRPFCAYGLGPARLMTSKTYSNSQSSR
jgi:hypothetical protein